MATGVDGRQYAVKVQHAGLRETSAADIATIELLVTAVRRLFPVGRSADRGCRGWLVRVGRATFEQCSMRGP